MNFHTQLLHPSHDKSAFHCGKRSADVYLKKHALQAMEAQQEACFVHLSPVDRTFIGYYTLANLNIPLALIPKELQQKIPRSLRAIPVTMLSRLAITEDFQHQGHGALLLIDALKRSYITSKTIGSFAVVAHTDDYNAVHFYKKYGFCTLPDSQKQFLVMKTITSLFT